MAYKELIKSWHLKAAEEDFFSKFVFEYLAFIAYLNTHLYPNCGNDRAGIQELKRNSTIRDEYLNKIRENRNLKSSWKKIRKELNSRPLGNLSRTHSEAREIQYWNCSHNDCTQKNSSDRAKRSGVIHSFTDWENMVEFWYSIRNNLFHGTKHPKIKRDKLLVKFAYKTLRSLVKIFLQKDY